MGCSDNYQIACAEIASTIVNLHNKNKKVNMSNLQTKTSEKYSLNKIPTIVDILAALPPENRHLRELFKTKPVRTASGVAVVAVMCKPHRCPHIALTGNICVYCPGGPDSDFEYSTQSYTGYEPTSMRAIRHRYDPYQQSRTRIIQLESLGHTVDKVEYIIMGGTFMSLPDQYKEWFIRGLHDALSGSHSSSLKESIKRSESSKVKCVGMTIETRPDFCSTKHLTKMLSYGCTRIEMGVQSVYEDVAFDTNRGHTVEEVCDAFCLTKDAGYKIVSHMMPNLPNVPMKRDYAQFIEFFENHRFRSDGLKIYPTLVIRGTGLYELWKNKKYKNYSPDELVDFLARILALVPPWTRIYRIQRDIPMPLVSSGVEYGNIREIALLRMKDYNTRCRDVRTREVGIKNIHEGILPEKIELVRRDYSANNGWETFLAYEDINKDILVGMLRLRKCSSDTFREELMENINKKDLKNEEPKDKFEINECCNEIKNENCSNKKENKLSGNKNVKYVYVKEKKQTDNIIYRDNIVTISTCKITKNDNVSVIRELHVYGSSVPVHQNDSSKFQHQGYGKLLIDEAERIALREHKSKKIAIISGVGTRSYYRKFGYHLQGPYMVKYL